MQRISISLSTFSTVVSAGIMSALLLTSCSGGGVSKQSGTSESSSGSGTQSVKAENGISSGNAGDLIEVKVGASPVPHAKILHFVADNLAHKAGIKLNVIEMTDYVTPNKALESGDIDANFFQTPNFLSEQEKQNGYKFTAGKGIHLEPLGIYSSKLKKLDEFPNGGKIGIISDPPNQARALKLLAGEGFVSIKDGDNSPSINTVKNLKPFEFIEVEGAQLARSVPDLDIAVLNGNFALEGGFKPSDALALEKVENSPYANLLVWKSDLSGEKLKGVQKLEELLHSNAVKDFINTSYPDKSVIPAF